MPKAETAAPPAEAATDVPDESTDEPGAVAEEVEQSTEEAADAATDESAHEADQSDMGYKIRCPVCGDTFKQPQGLHGHLRFSHNLHGDELDEIYEKAQSQEYMDFDDEGGRVGEKGQEQPYSRPMPASEPQSGPTEQDRKRGESGPVDDEGAVSGAFDWDSRLERMASLRNGLDRLDRSTSLGPFSISRDEGCQEAMEALDEIEMEVRERLGASDSDRELRSRVDESLDRMAALVRCREQREAIKEKFSGERAEQRIDRLDRKEAEIRAHVREEWNVGKPTEKLSSSDPVSELESTEEENQFSSDSGTA
jgi:hypothetical protein